MFCNGTCLAIHLCRPPHSGEGRRGETSSDEGSCPPPEDTPHPPALLRGGGGGRATRGILQKKLAMQDNSAGIHAMRSVGGKASSDEGSCPSTHVQLGSTSNGKHWPIRRRPWVPMEMSGVDLSPTPIHTRGLIPMELPLPTGKLRPWEQDSRCQWPQVEGQKCPLPPFVGLLLVLWVGFGIIF